MTLVLQISTIWLVKHTSLILKKAMPVSKESEPAWCCGPILSSSSCSATSCSPPCKNRALSVTVLVKVKPEKHRKQRCEALNNQNRRYWVVLAGKFVLIPSGSYSSSWGTSHRKWLESTSGESQRSPPPPQAGWRWTESWSGIQSHSHCKQTNTNIRTHFKEHTEGGFRTVCHMCHETNIIKDRWLDSFSHHCTCCPYTSLQDVYTCKNK